MNDVPSPRKAESEEERSAGVLSKTKGSFTDPKRPARTLPKWAQRPHLKEFTVSRRRGVSAWRRRRPRALGKRGQNIMPWEARLELQGFLST